MFLTLVVFLSGVLEVFYYTPTPEEAPLSIQTISFLVPFGGLVRNLHYWSAQLLVVVAVVHLFRVIFTGAYTLPRRLNYWLGLALLVLLLFLDFTGYGLRWDAGVHWALVAGTNLIRTIPWMGPGLYGMIVGGEQVGAATLVRFYAWHIFGLALALVIVGVWHLFRVRRDGGIAVPPPEQRADPSRISRFELARREGLAVILASAALLLLATFFPAPLAQPLTEVGLPSAEARAPWFFLWVQQLLKLGNPFLFGVFIPLMALALLVAIPYIPRQPRPAELGRWFPPGSRVSQFVAGSIALALLILTILALSPA